VSLEPLDGVTIAVIGYGTQGRAQALNLRDSGLSVIPADRSDAYPKRTRADRFEVFDIPKAVAKADIGILLIPDEIFPPVLDGDNPSRNQKKSYQTYPCRQPLQNSRRL